MKSKLNRYRMDVYTRDGSPLHTAHYTDYIAAEYTANDWHNTIEQAFDVHVTDTHAGNIVYEIAKSIWS